MSHDGPVRKKSDQPSVYGVNQILHFEKTLVDFGKVSKDSMSRRSISVTNSSPELVVIKNVRASCGCTTAVLETNRIAPGETTTLTLAFNPATIQKRFTVSISVHYEGHNKIDTLKIKGEVDPQLKS